MKPEERLEILRTSGTRDFLSGATRPPFPETVDNTMRTTARKCKRAFFFEHLLCRVSGSDNIHLVAGAAFAAANDVFRKSYYDKGSESYKQYEVSLDKGLLELIKVYGYCSVRESEETWAASPKSCERIIAAYLSYWHHYHPKLEPGKILKDDGLVMSEFAGTFELDVLHPVTGEKLKHSFRFDYIETRNGKVWLGDDKTTTSLGASWAKQWDLRSQFLAYTHAARLNGWDAVGCIARGTGILKNSISHMEVPIHFSPAVVEKWWIQVNKDFQELVDCWVKGEFDYDFAEGCAAYGGCKFVEVCSAKLEYKVLNMMPIRVWNPEHPDKSPVIAVEDL